MNIQDALSLKKFNPLIGRMIRLYPYGDINKLVMCAGVKPDEEILKSMESGEEGFLKLPVSSHCTGMFAAVQVQGQRIYRCAECAYTHANTQIKAKVKLTARKKAE